MLFLQTKHKKSQYSFVHKRIKNSLCVSKATFGKTVQEYKQFKSLINKKQNLRDHMNDLELIFTMLGESVTTQLTQEEGAIGMSECQPIAKKGGTLAGNARKEVEKGLDSPITSSHNYLSEPENAKRLKNKSKDSLKNA